MSVSTRVAKYGIKEYALGGRWRNTRQAAEYFGVSESYFRNAVRNHGIDKAITLVPPGGGMRAFGAVFPVAEWAFKLNRDRPGHLEPVSAKKLWLLALRNRNAGLGWIDANEKAIRHYHNENEQAKGARA